MKNIFITGIAGLLGSNCAYLLRDKYNIFGIDKNVFTIKNVFCEEDSALNTYRVEELLISNKIDVVVHCAALVNVDLCETMPAYADIVNYQLTYNLCRICTKLGIKMVFISTDAVYSGNKIGLNCEEDEPNPVNVYGKTKLMAEKAVMKVPNSVILRTNMYGFNYRNKNSFSEWIVHALNSDEVLNMFNDIYFSPMLVNKLCEVIDLIIDKDVEGLFNAGCTGSISKYDLGMAIKKSFDLSGTINSISSEEFSFSAPRTKNMGLDNKKLKAILGIDINDPILDIKLLKNLSDLNYPQLLKKGD